MGSHAEGDLLADALRSVVGQRCPACGEANSSLATVCGGCRGRLQPAPDDEVPLSYLHQEGLDRRAKTNLAQSSNLRLLRQTLAGAQAGQLSLEDYRLNVADVMEVARSGWELLGTSLFVAAPADVGGLVGESARLYEQFYRGCLQMMEYGGGHDLSPAFQGYARIEEALGGLDWIEDLVRQRIEEEEAA